MEKSDYMHLRISPKLKSRLQEAADQAHITTSQYLRNAIPSDKSLMRPVLRAIMRNNCEEGVDINYLQGYTHIEPEELQSILNYLQQEVWIFKVSESHYSSYKKEVM